MAEKTIEVKIQPRLDAVVVSPGDTLIVRANGQWTTSECAEFNDRLRQLLPGVNTVLIDADQILVYRPDGTDNA